MSLVGPGTLTEYEGPSRGSRQRGSVRVQKPAQGFFIAGSTIDEICGLFGQVNPNSARHVTDHAVHLCYKNDQTGWLMALVESPPEEVEAERRANRYTYEEPCGMEWLFIDKTGKDLFKHKGDTIVPGAGVRWKHLHRTPESISKMKAAREKAQVKERKKQVKRAEKARRGEQRRLARYHERVEKWKEIKREEILEAKRTLMMYGDGDNLAEDMDEDDIDDYLDEFDPEEAYMMGLGGYSDDESESSESSESEEEVEAAEESMRDRGAIVESKEDDENELPWQVIALLDESILRDLRWSNAYREKRVALALAGEDVDQPPTSSIEGFLEQEKKLAIDNVASQECVGWLYRVKAKDGVLLYNKPNSSAKSVGRRDYEELVRIVEVNGSWLRLAPSEKAEKEKPVSVGDAVHIISGMYKGERGTVGKALDAKREVGVKLKGYTGMGTFHITEVVLEAKQANSRPMKKNPYYDDSESSSEEEEDDEFVDGVVVGGGGGVKENSLWVAISNEDTGTRGKHVKADASTPALELVNVDAPSLTPIRAVKQAAVAEGEEETAAAVKSEESDEGFCIVEHDDAEVYDKPFEPRIEGENPEEDAEEEEEEEDGVYLPPVKPPTIETVDQTLSKLSSEDVVPVGSSVVLDGLSAEKYNGLNGVVITRENADGRHGVRIEVGEGKTEQILVRVKNLTVSAPSDKSNGSDSLAAAVLGLTLETLGLVEEGSGGGQMLHTSDALDLLDAVLRSSDRDHTLKSSEKVARAAIYEAIQAHRTLKQTLSSKDTPLPTSDTVRAKCAPHSLVEKGFLGKRAAAAVQLSHDLSSFTSMSQGVSQLQKLLGEEQGRLVRHLQEWETAWGAAIPVWRLQAAENKCAGSIIQSDDSEDTSGGSTDDCLFLRLCMISSLALARKDEVASQLALDTTKIYPSSAAAHLWHGRCLLRLGRRDDGAAALSRCVSVASGAGPGGTWAQSEGAARLRSLRRAKRCEIKAKDMYERGRFDEASSLYTDAIREYSGAGEAGGAGDDKWGRAEALIARASCHRRARKLQEAIKDCDAALEIFPKYARALFRRSICLLESQKPKEAMSSLERLLRVDRKWPKLLDWLVRAAAQAKRMENGSTFAEDANFEEGAEEGKGGVGKDDYYGVLGVTTDATDAQLKRAYRLKSLKAHPDRAGGSTIAFQLVALAYETLSDPEKRQLYDDGVDVKKHKNKKKNPLDSESDSEDEDGNKKKSIREEIERKYFPENFKFWPFGDPFIEKRRHDARKAKAAEQAKNRKANTSSRRQTWGFGGDY